MASLLWSRAGRPLQTVGKDLFTLQLSPFRAGSRRSVGTLVHYAVAGPTAIIDAVHGLGIPYYAAIPATAVLVRGTFVYLISTRPARQHQQLMTNVAPLAQARAKMKLFFIDVNERRSNANQPTGDALRSRTRWRRFLALRRSTSEINKALRSGGLMSGITRFRHSFNFLVLLSFAEAIRLKCGRPEGLLGLFLRPVERAGSTIDPRHFEGGTTADPAEILAAKLEANMEAIRQAQLAQVHGGSEVEFSQAYIEPTASHVVATPDRLGITEVAKLDTSSPYFDPALTNEGLSWCTDLTLADPTMTLPKIALMTFVTTSLLRPSTGKQKPDAEGKSSWYQRPTVTTGLRTAFYGVFALVATTMPSAILLYLIPSVAIGWMQERYLDFRYPVRPPIQPCTRPIRLRATQEWAD